MAMKATRTNLNEYTVTNQDGTSLKVSPHGTPGAFSPGELLQAALLELRNVIGGSAAGAHARERFRGRSFREIDGGRQPHLGYVV